MKRFMAWLRAWLLGSLDQPDWPLRCENRGCDSPAQPVLLRDGRCRFWCDDCTDHCEHLLASTADLLEDL